MRRAAPVLKEHLRAWRLYRIPTQDLLEEAWRDASPEIYVRLGGLEPVLLKLRRSHLFDTRYRVQTTGPAPSSHTRPIALQNRVDESPSALTLNVDFIYGFWTAPDGGRWYIEPYRYFDRTATARDWYVVYREQDVIPGNGTCGVTEMRRLGQKIAKSRDTQAPMQSCYQVDIAIASDYSMYQKYGTVTDVENHNAGITNNAQSNYVGEFNWDLIFNILVQYVVNTPGGDPWTSSTDAYLLLQEFADWGNQNGFGTTDYDIGELWSDRDFDGSTIGLAYIGAVCGTWRYHVLQDFNGTAEEKRVLVAHETGHNFNANHDPDGSPYIMAPTVSESTQWSTSSKNDINGFTQGIIGGCLPLISCPGAGPPIANFSGTPTTLCQGGTVQFTDLSTNNPQTWQWSFPGGTPSSYNGQTPPPIQYNTPGTYDVSLTVTNLDGSNTGTITDYITVETMPNPSFSINPLGGLTIQFVNTTNPPASSYSWDFGDPASGANNTSTEVSPTHTFSSDGSYVVVLTATNSCGSASYPHVLSVNTPATAEFTANPTSGCTPLTVQFTDQSSSNATQWTWTFPGGTPSSSTEQNPVVVYNNPGSYDVTLVAASPGGADTMTKTNYINVQETPTPGFTYTISGNTVNFTNTTSPLNGNTYQWDFGDNTSSTEVSPSHTYATAATYTVVLTVTSPSCGTVTTTQTINLAQPPVADFVASPVNGCAPLSVGFADLSTNSPTSWQWSFPGGTPNSFTGQMPPTIVYNSPGTYDVTLTVSNGAGSDTETKTGYIQVEGPPAAGFNYSVSGNTVNFTDASTGATTYSWNFGDPASGADNTSSSPNPSHVYNTDGTYTVTQTVSNNCGSQTTTQVVNITANTPTVAINSFTNPICQGGSVSYQATVSANTQSVQWTFEGGVPGTSTDLNPTVQYNTPGTYNVSVTAYNGNNQATATATITVLPNATADFASNVSGLDVSFTNTSTNGDSYLWDFGDNSTSTEFEPTHTYVADGTYNVCLTVTNSCNTVTTCHNVTISGNGPTASITASPTSGCVPLTVSYHADITPANAGVNWSFQGGTPSSSTSIDETVTYNAAGTYLTTLTVTNPSGTATDNVQINVLPQTDPSFTSQVNGSDVQFTNTSGGNPTTFAWDFGDGSTSTDEHPSHTYSTAGSYTVCLTTTNNCGAQTACDVVEIAGLTPTAAIEISDGDTMGCQPLTVSFHANTTNATTVAWTFDGGIPSASTAEDVTVTFNEAGTHQVTLTAFNDYDTAQAAPQTITVQPLPIASFTYTVSGYLVTVTNLSQYATSYLWNFGDGTLLTSFNPGHLYTTDTVTTITLISTNSCGSDTFSVQVSIGNGPSANPEASVTEGCAPLVVDFQANATNADTIFWEFPWGVPSTSTEVNPTVTYNAPGNYTAIIHVTNSLGTSTNTVDITVLPPAVAGFTYTVSDHTVSFTSTSQNANDLVWIFGDGQTATNVNQVQHTYNDGDYTPMLVVSNSCNSDTMVIDEPLHFESGNAPTAIIGADVAEGCAPLTVHFSSNSVNADNVSWTFQGGTPATSSAIEVDVVYSDAGDYVVQLTASNNQGSDLAVDTIHVHEAPVANFIPSGSDLEINFTNTSTGADSYLWDFGDGTTSTEESPAHTYGAPGSYNISLTASNAWCSDEIIRNIVITSLEDPLGELQISLTPNPGDGMYYLEVFADRSGRLGLTVFDELGRQLWSRDWGDTRRVNETIDLTSLAAGTYFFRLRFDGRILTGKLVKVR